MLIVYFILAALAVLLLLVLIAVIKTISTPARKSAWRPASDPERERIYAAKLSEMVKVETVSYHGIDQREKFLGFHKVLEELFPLVHAKLEKTEIDGNLLFCWKGKSGERPVVLMSHQDVVPAEGEWLHGPFSGDIADGKVWGRGSGDIKCDVMGFFQAVEELLADGYVPEQDVYLSSSCTEEVGGDGCTKLVEELKRRNVRPYLVCDEGGAIVESPLKGIEGYYAMVGILEKGMGDLKLSARSHGGHSSYPSRNSPIARLSKFVYDFERHDPMKLEFGPEVREMFKSISAYGPFHYRLLFGNLWLFGPLLKKILPSISPEAAALLRTTVAFTMQSGSEASNVLPQEATLTINLRYIPHQGPEESNAVIAKLAAKHDIDVEVLRAYGAMPPVNTDSDAFHLVERVIGEVFPGLPVCPYVMTGGTDARFYQEICDACIRFAPVAYREDQMKGMHGINENIDCSSLTGAVDFYKAIIKNNT
ncbi:MAG: M20/M25/M40 family metallo-hydrolase [Oscillospiraceae bacterium]|nr:M20/M25/M40 family metallo-hydrolase [Oscillospiraceae bacterium]